MEIVISNVRLNTAHISDEDIVEIIRISKKNNVSIQKCIQSLYDSDKLTINLELKDKG